jgi:hypothetical protein
MNNDDIVVSANSWYDNNNMNTINLGPAEPLILTTSSSGTNGINFKDLDFSYSQKYNNSKNEEAVDYPVSPLAIILELFSQGMNICDVVTAVMENRTNKVTDQNLELANEIKEYYRSKIITDTLSGKKRKSQFRSDLMMAIALLDLCQTKKSFIPMLAKLPSFYNEDTKMQDIVSKHTSLRDELLNIMHTDKNLELRLIDTVAINRRNLKKQSFFFVDSDNYLYTLDADLKNSLIPFMQLLTNDKIVNIKCRFKGVHNPHHKFNLFTIIDIKEVSGIKTYG